MKIQLFLFLFWKIDCQLRVKEGCEPWDPKLEVEGRSRFLKGVRTGIGGWKRGSNTSSNFYGTEDFRSSTLHSKFENFDITIMDPVLIPAFSSIRYDDRNYYWNGRDLMRRDPNRFICEYKLGEDDGVLSNLTFLDGSPAEYLYFPCPKTASCCGMYCCHDTVFYFLILLILIVALIIKCGCIWYRRTHC